MKILKRIVAGIAVLGVIPVMAASNASPTLANVSERLTQEPKVASTAVMSDSYPGIPEKFFSKGDAFISGKISDYTRDFGFDNLSLIYDNPLTGERTVKTASIADDGSFSAVIGMAAPGFIKFDGGNNWLSARYYAEPSRTLYIEFDFEDIKRQHEDFPKNYYIGQKVSRFGGDTGEINRQISACPLLKQCDIRTLANDAVPSVAAEKLNAIFEENKKITEDYINSHDLHPLSVRLLRNELLGQNADAFGEYEHVRIYKYMTNPEAPSLKENPDLSFYDWWKNLLTETDEWFLTSQYMEGSQSCYLASFLPYLIDAQTRYKCVVYFDSIAFLKSKGAILTPEEEEIAEWFATNVGKTLYYRANERNVYDEYLSKVYSLAVRAGLEKEYLEYYSDQRRRLLDSGVVEDNIDEAYNVNLTADAIKRFIGKDEVPFLWQAIQTYILTGGHGLNPDDYSEERMFEILDEIKNTKVITHPVVTEALADFYDRAYSPKDFDLPDDDRGRIIKEIIAPYEGKIILLDFWGTTCGLCRIQIEESADERRRNLDHPDFKRIFISSEADSPLIGVYNDYVAKNLSDETIVRLPDSDYRKVMDLFSFSGLPHYVLIDRKGKVIIPNFNNAHLKSYLYDFGVTLL